MLRGDLQSPPTEPLNTRVANPLGAVQWNQAHISQAGVTASMNQTALFGHAGYDFEDRGFNGRHCCVPPIPAVFN